MSGKATPNGSRKAMAAFVEMGLGQNFCGDGRLWRSRIHYLHTALVTGYGSSEKCVLGEMTSRAESGRVGGVGGMGTFASSQRSGLCEGDVLHLTWRTGAGSSPHQRATGSCLVWGPWRRVPPCGSDTVLALSRPSRKCCDPHRSFMNASFPDTR